MNVNVFSRRSFLLLAVVVVFLTASSLPLRAGDQSQPLVAAPGIPRDRFMPDCAGFCRLQAQRDARQCRGLREPGRSQCMAQVEQRYQQCLARCQR